jgi:alkane 1-monooxygenase
VLSCIINKKVFMNTVASPTPYVDRKRYAWLLSLFVPMAVGFGPALMIAFGNPLFLWASPVFTYLIVPLIDWLMGEDASNPPESAVPALEADMYYRWVMYFQVPTLWAAFAFGAWFFVNYPVAWYHVIALVLTSGAVGGFCINLGHEMGHKKSKLEKILTQLVLAPTAYGHFSIEHNRGHHRDVSTPSDPASSRMGENIYVFALREWPGCFKRALALERERLRLNGLGFWTVQNDILQTAAITIVFWGALAVWLGISALPFILAVAAWSNFQLTSANYIEHYGLLRAERSPGKYEICQPHHSWNSNHIFSNWLVYHLQRHSDHHAHPMRRYQSLRHFDHLPTLPSGYFGMFSLAYCPPLWFWVMDKRLLEVVGRDGSKINFQPSKQDALIERYQLKH